MQKILGSLALIMIGAGMWRVTDFLSPDAIGMALGVLIGVLAGIPVALSSVDVVAQVIHEKWLEYDAMIQSMAESEATNGLD